MANRFGQCCAAVALFVMTGCKGGFMIGCRDSKLADDLEWMDNTYNPHAGVSLGHGTSGWYVVREAEGEVLAHGTVDTLRSSGCSFEIDVGTDPKVFDKAITLSLRYQFDLHDIDPESVRAHPLTHLGGLRCDEMTREELSMRRDSCDFAEMDATTRNSRLVVNQDRRVFFAKRTDSDHDQTDSKKIADVYLGFDDPEYAKEFAAVFQDAVKRCGGTKGAAS